MMTRGQDTQGETDEFLPLNVEFLYLIERAASPSFHLQLPRNKEREELISSLLLLKTTTCPSCILIDPTCHYYFAQYPSSVIYVDAGQMPGARQPGSMRALEVDVVLLFLDRRVCVNHCGSSASPEESYRGMSTV